MDPGHITSEDFVKRSVWVEVSLGYAREQGKRKLVWLLGAVKADIEFEGTLVALSSGEHLCPVRDGSRCFGRRLRATFARSTESEDDARRRKREE